MEFTIIAGPSVHGKSFFVLVFSLFCFVFCCVTDFMLRFFFSFCLSSFVCLLILFFGLFLLGCCSCLCLFCLLVSLFGIFSIDLFVCLLVALFLCCRCAQYSLRFRVATLCVDGLLACLVFVFLILSMLYESPGR